MDQPAQGGWTVVSVPRIVVLTILNRFGISALDHLTVLAMAVPKNDLQRPRTYSHALLASSNLQQDWQGALARIRQPTRILIGANDELFVASAYPEAIGKANPKIPVTILPDQGHMTMMFDQKALTAEADAAVEMLK
jgi:pimeloyl-ACP methyl ester carboxylesterase